MSLSIWWALRFHVQHTHTESCFPPSNAVTVFLFHLAFRYLHHIYHRSCLCHNHHKCQFWIGILLRSFASSVLKNCLELPILLQVAKTARGKNSLQSSRPNTTHKQKKLKKQAPAFLCFLGPFAITGPFDITLWRTHVTLTGDLALPLPSKGLAQYS